MVATKKPVLSEERTTLSSLKRLAREGESLTVRNPNKNILVFTPSVQSPNDYTTWEAVGDPQGEDIQEIPASFLANSKFSAAILKGVLEIIDADDPAILDAIEAQRNSWQAKQQLRSDSDRMIESQQVKAYSGKQCIAQEGRGTCSEFSISSGNNNERPPLCSKHAHLGHEYLPEETGKFVEGKPEVRWTKPSLYRN